MLNLGVLSTDTIARVKELFWYDPTPDSSAQPLLRLLGSKLKTLRYVSYDGEYRDMAAELQSCAALERLDLDLYNGAPKGLLGHLPPTIHTLALCDLSTAHQLLVNNFASRSPSLKVVKLDADFWCYEEHEDDREYAEMERNQFKELVDTLKDTGVEFVVTGEGLREALEEMG